MVTLFSIGLTLSTIGKIMVVLAVLHIHATLVHEHRVDKRVILSYRQERVITWIGLVLIVIGYVLELRYYMVYVFHFSGYLL